MAAALTQHSRWTFSYWWKYIKAVVLRSLLYIPQKIAVNRQWQTIPPNVRVECLEIRSRDPGRRIKVHVFEKDQDTEKPRPVHLNWHGSGFTLPQMGTDTTFCAQLADHTDAVVVDCDYRKAPESAYPLPFEDAEDVLAFVRAHPERFNYDKITLSGFSAGFALAAYLAGILGESAKGLISIYGNPDYTSTYDPPSNDFDSGRQLSLSLRRFFYSNIFTENVDCRNHLISLKYRKTEDFPRHVLFMVGTADYLFTPAQQLAERLTTEGHPDCTFLPMEREAHAFDKLPRTASSRARVEKCYNAACDLVRRAHRG